MIDLKDRLTEAEMEEFFDAVFGGGSNATLNGVAHVQCALQTNNFVLFALGFSKREIKAHSNRIADKMLNQTVKKKGKGDHGTESENSSH